MDNHVFQLMITGGSRGIGLEIAHFFSAKGARVIIVDKTSPQVALPKNTTYHSCDITSNDALESLITETISPLGYLDCLINNARSKQRHSLSDSSFESLTNIFSVDAFAPLILTEKLLPYLKRSKAPSILNMSSLASERVCGEPASYHMSKAALDSLTRYLATELGPQGVRVNAIRPGFIVQEEHRNTFESPSNLSYRKKAIQAHPLKAVGRTKDIAEAAYFLCSESASFITGQALTIDGGLCLRDGWHQLNEVSVDE